MKSHTYKLMGMAALLLGLGQSCKDFVDLKSPTVVNRDDYFNRESDITAAVNGMYNSLRGYYGNYYVVAEVPSDNTEANGANLGYADMDQQTWMNNNSYVQSLWLSSYSTISRANIILDKIDAVTMNDNLKKQYKGEALFVRSLMYFQLTQFFGDVPLILKEVKTEAEAYGYQREAVSKIYAQLETDLQAAAEGLLPTYTGASVGRAPKAAAQALLGKMYIATGQFEKAVPVLKAVKDAGDFGLLDNYESVFSATNRNNREIIYSVQYLAAGNGEGSNFCIAFAPFGSGTEITSGGFPAGSNQGTEDLFNAFEAGDLRKGVAIARYPATNALYTRKFIDRPIASNEGRNNWPVLRYADVLLMYAEALNETGATGEAIKPLNEVRKRAGLEDVEDEGQVALRDTILHERRVELCFEGHRWLDLLRTGKMLQVMTDYKEKYTGVGYLVENYDIKARNVLYPVPFRERSLNPNLSQNDGYE
ncbi:RagB/SusD family nutrient uptake outer membrane protein [Chitinophaga alhagiae]|uniref:RagB/SusD family nutrient uptake outer membrane protein n=1 Tax=Chitinophaga alhagiae TaxID=2203219 RepID=A0ABM6WAY0_9BACT|nr:RagB/SusD family nutrient uptake outer membrane protein [Chitinophaga alhagiae]AWO01001.1 RagB/SusD family nutrient uptake outer membrane protein [Chitinophaga alhagiae]